MRFLITTFTLCAMLGFSIPAVSAQTFQAKVVSVTDGDSFNVETNGGRKKVILYGVDCPETG
jgi:endonuclease YncB( thermonuclease family)